MAIEIERKFLVDDLDAALAGSVACERIAQGYLSADPDATVRVRIRGERGFLTVKSRNRGAERGEWEYEIPEADVRELLALSRTPIVDKVRHRVPFGGLMWEVDVFSRPAGLVLAEVELPRADARITLPYWVGREVTSDPRYFNSNLALSQSAEI